MASSRAVIVVLLFAGSLVAGCVSGDDSGKGNQNRRNAAGGRTVGDPLYIPEDWFEVAVPQGPAHNHRDRKMHLNLSTPNFEVLGYDPLITDYYGRSAGDYFCGDAKEKDGKRLSVVHSWGSDVAFVLVDVTDPRNPVKLGELAMANTQVYDIQISPDFNFVVMSTSPFDSGPDSPEGFPPIDPDREFMWTDACTGERRYLAGPESGLPYSSGVALVDISNPRNPAVADFRQLPVIGSHSVQISTAKGATIITVSIDNGASTASYYAFFEIRSTPVGGKLWLLSEYNYVPENQARAQPSIGVHMDGTVAEHPITHQRLAWLAFRSVGFIMVNLDDPTMPRFIANWRPFPVGIHSVLPLSDTWDGRHFTILGEECGGRTRGNPTCLIYVVDTTDPSKPNLVAAWTLPLPELQWTEGLQFSTHYYALVNRTLFVSTYHGGLWAVDLTKVTEYTNITSLPSIGVLIPDRESPKPVPPNPPRSLAGKVLLNTVANAPLADRPTVMDAVAGSDGTIVTWDGQGGLYTVRFNESWPAPPPQPFKINGIGIT